MRTPILLPRPREITPGNAVVILRKDALIAIRTADLLFEAELLQRALIEYADRHWELVAGAYYDTVGITLAIDPQLKFAQSYRLVISQGGITVHGADHAGVFYGVCTLRQLLQLYGPELPELSVLDWPDYPVRGVLLDISRDKVPTMQTLYELIERLASWKVNQLQLYMEHTFAYRRHPDVWREASPLTGHEILELDLFCRRRHIELVPNQNSLGHMERWLKHEQYRPLAECPDGFEQPWGGHSGPTTLNPVDPRSLDLVYSLYDELLPHFTSRLFNVGGDEPWELGKGKSKSQVEAEGGRVYLNYILKLYEAVKQRGRQMQFWADIIVKYPDLVPELPTDVTAMLWGYESYEPPEKDCQMVAEAGVAFYVCAGTSSWNSLVGRTDNAMANLRTAAVNGLKHGASGYLITDWGDNGHWQPLPISYLGFAYGAALSWFYDGNHDLDVPAVLDLFAFDDEAGIMGKLAFDLGNTYQLISPAFHNGLVLAYSLRHSRAALLDPRNPVQNRDKVDVNAVALKNTIARMDEILSPIDRTVMRRADTAIIQQEFRQAVDLLKFSARRLLAVLHAQRTMTPAQELTELERLIDVQRSLWLARNRPGGLADSLARFNILLEEFQAAV